MLSRSSVDKSSSVVCNAINTVGCTCPGIRKPRYKWEYGTPLFLFVSFFVSSPSDDGSSSDYNYGVRPSWRHCASLTSDPGTKPRTAVSLSMPRENTWTRGLAIKGRYTVQPCRLQNGMPLFYRLRFTMCAKGRDWRRFICRRIKADIRKYHAF